MTNEEKAMVAAVINTLNLVTVRGADNLNYILGSINALGKLIQEGTDDGDIHAEQ